MRLSVASKIPPDEEDRHDEGDGNDTYGKQEPEDVHALGTLLGAGVLKEKLSALNIAGVLLALAAVGCLFYGVGWF